MSILSRPAVLTFTALSFLSCGGGGKAPQVDTTIPVITSFTANPSTVKAGEAVQLVGNFGDASGLVTPGLVYMASNTPLTVHPTVSTTYHLEVTNQLGKKAQADTNVRVKPNATITPDIDRAPYVTSMVDFRASVPDQGNSTTYSWSATGATIAFGRTTPWILVHADAPGNISLSCVVSYSSGETDTQTLSLTSVAPPDATLTMDWAKAPYATTGVDGYVLRIPPGQGSAMWTYDSGLEITASNSSQLTFRPRAYYSMNRTVTCKVTNAAMVEATSSVVVKVVAPPSISAFTIAKPILTRGEHTQLTFTYTGGVGTIQPDGTALTTDYFSGQGSLEVAPDADRTYRLVVANLAGDAVEAQTQVRLAAPPVLSSFTASGIYSSPDQGIQLTAVFQDGQATLDPGGISMQSGVPVTVKPGIPTRYRVTVLNEGGTIRQDRKVIIPSGGPADSCYSSYAVSSAGQLFGWGSNTRGQLGLGHHFSQNLPTLVPGMADVQLIEVGDRVGVAPGFMLALKRNGTLWASGANDKGQLGLGTRIDGLAPTQVMGISDVILLACGLEHTVALKSDGTVWVWGANPHGELGTGGTGDILSPTQLMNLPAMVLVGAQQTTSVALAADGTVWTWGSGNLPAPYRGCVDPLAIHKSGLWIDGKQIYFLTDNFNSLDGTGAIGYTEEGSLLMEDGRILLRQRTGNRPTLPLDGGVGAIRWSGRSLLKPDGTLYSYGLNSWGEAGDTVPLMQTRPVQVPGLGPVSDMTMGGFIGAARKQDGSIWAWGRLNYQNLRVVGDLSPIPLSLAQPQAAPITMAPGTGPMAASASDLWVGDPVKGPAFWGIDQAGEWKEPSGILILTGGDDHFLSLTGDGSLWASGACNQGQLGVGFNAAMYSRYGSWVKAGSSGLTALAAGNAHSLALQADGHVLGFGRNLENQAGPGLDQNIWNPTLIPALDTIIAIAAGGHHSLALKGDGSVWAWGEGIGGTPVQVSGLSGITAISAGSSHFLALKSDGTVWAWGANTFGQLGSGDTVDAATPAQILDLSQVVAIQAKANQSSARDASGNLWVWGADTPWGQLGQGRLLWIPTPRPVPGAPPLW